MFEFYRCYSCKRPIERRKMLRDVGCFCGSRKVNETRLNFFELWFYILTHFECIKLIIFGDKNAKDEE